MCLCFSTRVLQRRNGKTRNQSTERRQKDAAFPLPDGGERQSDGEAGLVLVSWCLGPNTCVQLCPQTGHRKNAALRPFPLSLDPLEAGLHAQCSHQPPRGPRRTNLCCFSPLLLNNVLIGLLQNYLTLTKRTLSHPQDGAPPSASLATQPSDRLAQLIILGCVGNRFPAGC